MLLNKLDHLVLQDVNTLGIGLSRSNAATRPVSMPRSVQKIPDIINNAYTGVKAGNLGTVLSNITGELSTGSFIVVYRTKSCYSLKVGTNVPGQDL